MQPAVICWPMVQAMASNDPAPRPHTCTIFIVVVVPCWAGRLTRSCHARNQSKVLGWLQNVSETSNFSTKTVWKFSRHKFLADVLWVSSTCWRIVPDSRQHKFHWTTAANKHLLRSQATHSSRERQTAQSSEHGVQVRFDIPAPRGAELVRFCLQDPRCLIA